MVFVTNIRAHFVRTLILKISDFFFFKRKMKMTLNNTSHILRIGLKRVSHFVCLIQYTEEKNDCGKFASCCLFVGFFSFLLCTSKQYSTFQPSDQIIAIFLQNKASHRQKKAKPFTHNPTLRLSPSIKYFIIISMFIYKYTLHKDTIKFIQG